MTGKIGDLETQWEMLDAAQAEIAASALERDRRLERSERRLTLLLWFLAAVAVANLIDAAAHIAQAVQCR